MRASMRTPTRAVANRRVKLIARRTAGSCSAKVCAMRPLTASLLPLAALPGAYRKPPGQCTADFRVEDEVPVAGSRDVERLGPVPRCDGRAALLRELVAVHDEGEAG